ncbi:MAG: hypothetical protein EOR57_13730 [Mesorhizobium sp.]|uniref:hypothetical protein n=1 Tax=Mesorhizobium sp. TaxID=1871066 RepID=UPI000FE9E107|nr:hypothetical protein [Mesorhizobium sp.]RWL19654.1 MAG: hypothetical protein EOR57_13730 [Mesorhizobium sp.]
MKMSAESSSPSRLSLTLSAIENKHRTYRNLLAFQANEHVRSPFHCIEDQVLPKKCGHLDDKKLVDAHATEQIPDIAFAIARKLLDVLRTSTRGSRHRTVKVRAPEEMKLGAAMFL